jgi:hypothetical protein
VKGKPRALHVQEFSKKGNEPFKQALKDWIPVNNTDSWHVCVYITNQQMNNHPNEGRDMLTPHQIYYSQEDERTFEDILGDSAWISIEGDTLFDQKFNIPIEEREQFNMHLPLSTFQSGCRSSILQLWKESQTNFLSNCSGNRH